MELILEYYYQIRAKIKKNDSIHSIGNRLIKDSASECVKIIKNFNMLKKHKNSSEGRLYRNKDFNEECIKEYYNLDQKIENYLSQKLLLIRNFQ